jgi:hypothetical protein
MFYRLKRIILIGAMLLIPSCLHIGCKSYYRDDTEIIATASAGGLTGGFCEYRVTIKELIEKNVKTNIWIIVIYDRFKDID